MGTRSFILALAAVLTAAFTAPSAVAQAGGTGGVAVGEGEGRPVLLAQAKKKKRKKRKKKKAADGEAPVVEDAGGGGDMHSKQEGTEEPYSKEVSLLSDFSITNTKTGEAKGGTADYQLSGKILWIMARAFEIGGGLDYNESSFKTEDDTSTSSDYVLKLLGVYNLGNIDEDEMLFFVSFGLGLGSGKTKAGDVESKYSTTQFGFGGGVRFFVDENVALTGELTYDMGSKKADGGGDPTSFSTIHLLKVGFSLFL